MKPGQKDALTNISRKNEQMPLTTDILDDKKSNLSDGRMASWTGSDPSLVRSKNFESQVRSNLIIPNLTQISGLDPGYPTQYLYIQGLDPSMPSP